MERLISLLKISLRRLASGLDFVREGQECQRDVSHLVAEVGVFPQSLGECYPPQGSADQAQVLAGASFGAWVVGCWLEARAGESWSVCWTWSENVDSQHAHDFV